MEKGKVRGGKGDGKFEEKGKESEGKRGTEEGKVKWRMKKKEEGKGNLRVEGRNREWRGNMRREGVKGCLHSI